MDRYSQRDELPQVVPEAMIATRASQEFNRELRQEKRQKWLRRTFVTLIASLIFGGALTGGYLIWRASTAPVVVVNQPADKQKQTRTTLFYAVQTATNAKANRNWPTYTIYQKVIGEDSEKELLKVGDDTNFAADLVIDKTGKYLAVNYETKLTVYELSTGSQKLSLNAGTGLMFSRPVFSADGNSLYAFEVTDAINDKKVSLFASTISVGSGQQKREVIAAETPALYAAAWTKDKLIAGMINYTGSTQPFVFDLQSGSAQKIAEPTSGFVVSQDGSLVLLPSDLVPDALNCQSGQNPSGFVVYDTNSLKQSAAYNDGSFVYDLSQVQFSQDNQKVWLRGNAPEPGDSCANLTRPELQDISIKLSDKQDSKLDTTNLTKEGFSQTMRVEPDSPTEPKLNFLKYGSDIIRSSTPQNPIVPIVIVSTEI